MGEITASDGAVLSRLVGVYAQVLRAHQEELNRLNVYPVPDGDTGTNMVLTVESVLADLGSSCDLDAVCHAVTHGSLMGARGNSGVILSQILRGLCDTFREAGAIGPPEVAAGLDAGARAARAAVMHPVEGTILTVARAAADAASAAVATWSGANDTGLGAPELVVLVDAARAAAHDAVARSPSLLPALARAGVVDAGGLGFALLFDAWLHVLDGRPLPEPSVPSRGGAGSGGAPGPVPPGEPVGPRYEVMFLLDAPAERIDAFREAWDRLGESVVVVGDAGAWSCHVHTDDIGAAIEAGIAAGRPSRIEVTDLWEQVGRREADWVAAARPGAACGVVAVANGPGVVALLRNLGVTEVVPGGQTMNPSTQDIAGAIDRVRADAVVVLPNNENIVAVARQAAALASRPVEVVPTRSVVEGLSALLEFDRDGSVQANAAAMSAAAERVRTGEVTRAVRDGVAECGPITAGDWIGITRGGIRVRATSALDAVCALVDDLVTDDDELLTVLVGDGVDPDEVQRVRAHCAEVRPGVEVEIHDGGQPLYPYLIGVE